MKVHGIYGAYFDDFEFDINKTVGWAQNFTSSGFVYTSALAGKTYDWVVAWNEDYPGVGFATDTTGSFFEDAAAWRRRSFLAADRVHRYADDDWVLFIDGTEGLNFHAPSPDASGGLAPPGEDLFLWWLESEAAEAAASLYTAVALPFYVYVRPGPLRIKTQAIDTAMAAEIVTRQAAAVAATPRDFELLRQLDDMATANTQAIFYHVPQFVEAGFIQRMFQVSALRDPGFDWGVLDTVGGTYSGAVATSHTAIDSYAYARWAIDPADLDHQTMSPISISADVGFRMRQMISAVRPVPGLPYAAWSNTDTPTVGSGPDPTDPTVLADFPELQTPIYRQVFRQDLAPVSWNYQVHRPRLVSA